VEITTPTHQTLDSTISLEARQEILLKQDVDGNTPLHLSCANLELEQEESSPEGQTSTTNTTINTAPATTFDARVVEAFAMPPPPNANDFRNDQDGMPLALLLWRPPPCRPAMEVEQMEDLRRKRPPKHLSGVETSTTRVAK
jgi:hypothetical protein